MSVDDDRQDCNLGYRPGVDPLPKKVEGLPAFRAGALGTSITDPKKTEERLRKAAEQ